MCLGKQTTPRPKSIRISSLPPDSGLNLFLKWVPSNQVIHRHQIKGLTIQAAGSKRAPRFQFLHLDVALLSELPESSGHQESLPVKLHSPSRSQRLILLPFAHQLRIYVCALFLLPDTQSSAKASICPSSPWFCVRSESVACAIGSTLAADAFPGCSTAATPFARHAWRP